MIGPTIYKDELPDALVRDLGPREALQVSEKIFSRIKERPVQILGSGTMGVAYLLPSGKVLKLTSDEDEVDAMNLMKEKRGTPNLLSVYDVFTVKTSRGPMGVIVRDDAGDSIQSLHERYPFLSGFLTILQDQAAEVYYDRRREVGNKEARWEAMLFYAQALMDDDYREHLRPEELALLPDIAKAVHALMEIGVYTIDLLPDNIAIRDGEIFVFDPGFGDVEEKRPVDMAGRRGEGMVALIIKDRHAPDEKLKFKNFREAAEHARMVIIPQIGEELAQILEQGDPHEWRGLAEELLDLIPDLFGPEDEVREAIEKWARLMMHDRVGELWIEVV